MDQEKHLVTQAAVRFQCEGSGLSNQGPKERAWQGLGSVWIPSCRLRQGHRLTGNVKKARLSMFQTWFNEQNILQVRTWELQIKGACLSRGLRGNPVHNSSSSSPCVKGKRCFNGTVGRGEERERGIENQKRERERGERRKSKCRCVDTVRRACWLTG